MSLSVPSRKKFRILIGTVLAFLGGEVIKVFFGDWIVKNALEKISQSSIYQNYVIPYLIAAIPILIVVIVLAYLVSKEGDDPQVSSKENGFTLPAHKSSESANEHQNQNCFSLEKNRLLNDLGIIDVTPDLKDSVFHPRNCMTQTRKQLMFMGILGSKWVDDPGFEDFVKRIDLVEGSLRFLLIHPQGRSFVKLTELRQGKISSKSLAAFLKLKKRFPALRIKLYEDLPVFRLVFFDGHTLALSRYRLDHHGYFESKQGWDAPHLVISSTPSWTLYETFEEYFNNVWNRSTDLDDYFASAELTDSLPAVPRQKKEKK